MPDQDTDFDFEALHTSPAGERGGFVALAIVAAAVGAGAALLLAPDRGAKTRQRVGRGLKMFGGGAAESLAQLQGEVRRRRQSRSEKRFMAVAGLVVGAGVAALLTPESGSAARQRLSTKLSQIKVGAIDRIDRLRQWQGEKTEEEEKNPVVRSVQELGRDSNTVF